jgi:hypothetical protein
MSIMIRCILAKNLTGWEAMEIFAGGVSQSDQIFMVGKLHTGFRDYF